MNYKETLDYLYKKLPMFSRVGSSAFKKDLINTLRLCSHLNNPQNNFKSIHVAGTNGKGSVSHMLAAILAKEGYKTGLYTSPHLYDFRERIRIDGQVIEEAFVVDFVQQVTPLIEEIEPSFFEITVAMAFYYFAQQEVDVAIIEVGLGGRLDSTNVITPLLSVITNIGWDHMNMLGNTLQQIASEKAGIIKKNVPVIIGERKEETASVFVTKAKDVQAPIHFAEDLFTLNNYHLLRDKLEVEVSDTGGNTDTYLLDLPGIYQLKNILTVLSAIQILKSTSFNVSSASVHAALENVNALTGLKGRWEVIQDNPLVVFEVAHNIDGIQQMLDHLQHVQYHQLHIIFGTVKDKSPEPVLALLPRGAQYYFTQSAIPRALAVEELNNLASQYELKGEAFPNVNAALKKALVKASEKDMIIVCGSIFLVAEIDRSAFA